MTLSSSLCSPPQRVDLTYEEALAVVTEWEPELIVCDVCDFVGPMVATKINVPHMLVKFRPEPIPPVLDALAVRLGAISRASPDASPADRPGGRMS